MVGNSKFVLLTLPTHTTATQLPLGTIAAVTIQCSRKFLNQKAGSYLQQWSLKISEKYLMLKSNAIDIVKAALSNDSHRFIRLGKVYFFFRHYQ